MDNNYSNSDIKKLYSHFFEFKEQLIEANKEIEKLRNRVADLERMVFVDTDEDEHNAICDVSKTDELFAFYELSEEELNSIMPLPESINYNTIKSTSLSAFKIKSYNGEKYVEKYIGKNGGEVVIPEEIAAIGPRAFCNCSRITSVIIPDSVYIIGGYAFFDCQNLSRLILPQNANAIGDNAFFGCKSLKSIMIPSGITEIGAWTFSFCTSLTDISIPDGTESIGDFAFKECVNLKTVSIPDSVVNFGNYVFANCNDLTICCSGQSIARRYAEKNKIAYKLID